MAAERKPGSNLGRAAIDWAAAFLYYASLPADCRGYQAVADKFGVSVRTVERHGRTDRWTERARELDRTAAELAAERLRDERVDALIDLEKLAKASIVSFAGRLRDGQIKMTVADLQKLHKLLNELWEQTDAATPIEPTASETTTVQVDSTEYQLDVVRALIDAGVIPLPTASTEACEQSDDAQELAS
jgi:hypothetical protein